MNEMDNKVRIVELRLKLAKLKQKDIESIAEFVGKVEVLAQELPNSEVNIGMVIAQEILDLNHKGKLLFKYAWSKSFLFSTIKTFVKALYFFQGKNNLFNPSYRELKSVSLSLPIQLTEELV